MTIWGRAILADVCEKPQYGAIASASDEPVGPKFVRQTDIVSGRVDWTTVPYAAIGAAEAVKYELREGDLLVSRLGAGVGNAARMDETPGAVFAGYLVRFRTRPEVADSRFVGYALRSEQWRAHVQAVRSGGAQPTLNAKQMGQFDFVLPPLEEQQRIAGVLGAYDDLIKTNRTIIDTLHNSISAAYSLVATTSPSTTPLRSIADHLPGKYLKKEDYRLGGTYPVYGSNSVMGFHSSFLYEGPMTVLARIGSNCGALRLSTGPAWINNNASVIKAKDPTLQYRLHEALRRIEMDRHRTGSGQPFIRIKSLMDEEVPWPERACDWDQSASVMLNVADELAAESRDLAQHREELLSLLMSGKVQVRELEED